MLTVHISMLTCLCATCRTEREPASTDRRIFCTPMEGSNCLLCPNNVNRAFGNLDSMVIRNRFGIVDDSSREAAFQELPILRHNRFFAARFKEAGMVQRWKFGGIASQNGGLIHKFNSMRLALKEAAFYSRW